MLEMRLPRNSLSACAFKCTKVKRSNTMTERRRESEDSNVNARRRGAKTFLRGAPNVTNPRRKCCEEKKKKKERECSFLPRSSRGVSASQRNFSTRGILSFFPPFFALFTRPGNLRHDEVAGSFASRPETSRVAFQAEKLRKLHRR